MSPAEEDEEAYEEMMGEKGMAGEVREVSLSLITLLLPTLHYSSESWMDAILKELRLTKTLEKKTTPSLTRKRSGRLG